VTGRNVNLAHASIMKVAKHAHQFLQLRWILEGLPSAWNIRSSVHSPES